MENQVLHTVWRKISGEAAEEIWNLSLIVPVSLWLPCEGSVLMGTFCQCGIKNSSLGESGERSIWSDVNSTAHFCLGDIFLLLWLTLSLFWF